ncbi:MAG: DUF2461 family protein, partial [Actinomycetota bacterium]
VYDEQVARPLKQLVVAVGERLAAGPAQEIEYEPKIGRSMFRINRDLRFSKDKTPYHPHLDVAWWQGEHAKTSPGFIMRIRHDEVLTGVGVFALADDRLARFRDAVVGPPGEQLVALLDDTRRSVKGAALSEPTRKRVPKGFDPDHPRADLLRFDGLHMSGVEPVPASITSARFAGWVADRLAKYAGIHRWLVDHT